MSESTICAHCLHPSSPAEHFWWCELKQKRKKDSAAKNLATSLILPTDSAERKKYPIGTGVLDYFPDAIAEIALVSWTGNKQHNPGEPLHWDREKSMDQEDTMQRHYLERGTRDKDGMRHTAKMAWRALAILQLEIEREREKVI